MTCSNLRRYASSFLVAGLLAVFLLWVAPSSYASLTVTDPEGNPTGDHFTDFTMVPGDTQSTTVFLTHSTEETVRAGMRLEPLSEATELHDAIEITVEGLGSTQVMSLTEAVQNDSVLWLGELRPQRNAEVTLTAHFPFSSGNETQRTEAPFRVIFTAQQLSPEEAPEETDAPSESEPGETAGPGAQHPGGQLPDTGSAPFLLVLLASVLLLTGLAAFRTARK